MNSAANNRRGSSPGGGSFVRQRVHSFVGCLTASTTCSAQQERRTVMKKLVFGVAIALIALGSRPALGADIALLNSETQTANYFSRNYDPIACTAANTWPLGNSYGNEYNRYWK